MISQKIFILVFQSRLFYFALILILISNPLLFYFESYSVIHKEPYIQIGDHASKNNTNIGFDSISDLREKDNYDFISGEEILVVINNISNLQGITNNFENGLYFKVDPVNSIHTNRYDGIFKIKSSAFLETIENNNNESMVFYLNSELINSGEEFSICIYSQYYDKNIICKKGTYFEGEPQEKISINIPHILNLDSLIYSVAYGTNVSNIKLNNSQYLNTSIIINNINISNSTAINLGYDVSDYDGPKFYPSINNLFSIYDDYSYTIVKQINGSNIENYTDKKISGNGVLDIYGFDFNPENQKIYAFGIFHYSKGDPYNEKYGLATEYHDHSIFVINPSTAKIIDSVVLWSAEEEGDETRIGDLYLNNKKNEIYSISLDEGELDDIFVIDIGSLKVKEGIPVYSIFGIRSNSHVSFDTKNDILYMCTDNSIIGVDVNEAMVQRNLSSVYCPSYINSNNQMGYFIDHSNNVGGIIDMYNGTVSIMLNGGNISDIEFDEYNNIVHGVGHSSDFFSYSCSFKENINEFPTSFLISMNIDTGAVVSFYEFENTYIDKIIKNSYKDEFYIVTSEISFDKYNCITNSKLYHLISLLDPESR